MNRILKILLIILGVLVLLAGGYFLYREGYQSGSKSKTTVSPLPTTFSSPRASANISPSPLVSPSPTSSGEKTVKDAHCLQNPAKNNQIQVTNPQDYSTLEASSLTFSGTASVFEGEFRYRLKDCRGPVLSEGSVVVNGEAGSDSPYSKTLSVDLSRSPMDAILEVFELSMADGSEINLAQVPLRLTK